MQYNKNIKYFINIECPNIYTCICFVITINKEFYVQIANILIEKKLYKKLRKHLYVFENIKKNENKNQKFLF